MLMSIRIWTLCEQPIASRVYIMKIMVASATRSSSMNWGDKSDGGPANHGHIHGGVLIDEKALLASTKAHSMPSVPKRIRVKAEPPAKP